MGIPGPADGTDKMCRHGHRENVLVRVLSLVKVSAAGGGGLFPDGLAVAAIPSNLGKVADAALADADPLGVNQNVTFDEVWGA